MTTTEEARIHWDRLKILVDTCDAGVDQSDYDALNALRAFIKERGEDPPLWGADTAMGFASWLTTRDEAVTIGAEHDSTAIAELLNEYRAIRTEPTS